MKSKVSTKMPTKMSFAQSSQLMRTNSTHFKAFTKI